MAGAQGCNFERWLSPDNFTADGRQKISLSALNGIRGMSDRRRHLPQVRCGSGPSCCSGSADSPRPMGYQMLALTIGWQVYELTNSAFDLGLVGLIQFVPAVDPHFADRPCRRPLRPPANRARGTGVLRAGRNHDHVRPCCKSRLRRDLLFAAVFIIGCARAFETADRAAPWHPRWCRQALISRAVAAWASANQTAVICGPARWAG